MIKLCILFVLILGLVKLSTYNPSDLQLPTSTLAAFSGETSSEEKDEVTVEDLMYKYKSDKSRDDHGYTKLYDMLFSETRHSIKNMTEVGIASGQSIQAWYRYFPNAEIHGFDIRYYNEITPKNMEFLKPRVHAHIVDVLAAKKLSDVGLVEDSMDLVIEDGPHTAISQELFLQKLFPIVKPGGFYVIEDIGYKGIRNNGEALQKFYQNPDLLMPETRKILEDHDTIFVSSAIGHRAWGEWLKRSGDIWAKDWTQHNSNLIVIKKRKKPLRPLEMFVKAGAMHEKGVIAEDGSE